MRTKDKKTKEIMICVCENEMKRMQITLIVGGAVFAGLVGSSLFSAYTTASSVLRQNVLANVATSEAQFAAITETGQQIWFSVDKAYLPIFIVSLLATSIFWKKANLYQSFKRLRLASHYFSSV